MNDLVVAWSPFNAIIKPFGGWRPGDPHPALSRKWIEDRFDIWKKYTYSSIAHQTNRRFLYLVSCNLLTKNITDEVFSDLLKKDHRVKLFYHGIDSFHKVLKNLRTNFDNILAIRIDSDDMYSIDTFEYVLKNFPDSPCGYFLKGYGYHHKSKKLWKYDCCKSGPFYVVKYPKGMYRFDAIEHPYIKKMGGVILQDGHFIVSVHDKNYSTRVRPPFFKEEVIGPERFNILKRFSFKE